MTTISISASRKQQISDELTKLGIDPTDEALAAVVSILKSNRRATLKSACKRYAQNQQPTNHTKTTTNKPSGSIKDGLGKLAGNLKDSMKKQVVSAAVVGLVRDLESGDYGSLDDLAVEELNDLIDAEFSVLEVSDLDPKYLLSSSGSKLLLEGASTEN